MDNTFGINIIPGNEVGRQKALERYQILGSPPENSFNHVARLTAQIFKVPISLVSLVGAEQVFFKANFGMGNAKSSSRGQSLCSLAVLQPGVTVFEDARKEPCLLANPLVAGNFGLQFYAGAPLTTHDGYAIGTLCIIDKAVRKFSDQDRQVLEGLAKIVMDEIELRLSSINEAKKQQRIADQLATINEELLATNDELSRAQDKLLVVNNRLAESETMKNMAIEQAQLGMWHIDAITRNFIPSNKLKEFFGYDLDDEMTYEAAINCIRSDYREKIVEEVNTAIQQGKYYHQEYPIIRNRDGKQKWVRATGQLNISKAGGAAYFSGTMLDITEQKQDEQLKNDFIAIVSHELKTPLTSMNGYLQMLGMQARKNQDSMSLSTLDKAKKQTNKMTTMINGFLDVARLEEGKIYIDRKQFDIAGLIEESEEESLATITTHKVIFTPVETTLVDADRDKIGQVITNLINNAVKYSPEGSTIQVTCVTTENNAQVSVQDEGMGISPQDLNKLFDRFYRVENRNTEKINGFGIGLYLCYEIVNRHGGRIWAESSVGLGSTFYFTLPVVI